MCVIIPLRCVLEQAGVTVCSDEGVCYITVACAGAGKGDGVL